MTNATQAWNEALNEQEIDNKKQDLLSLWRDWWKDDFLVSLNKNPSDSDWKALLRSAEKYKEKISEILSYDISSLSVWTLGDVSRFKQKIKVILFPEKKSTNYKNISDRVFYNLLGLKDVEISSIEKRWLKVKRNFW